MNVKGKDSSRSPAKTPRKNNAVATRKDNQNRNSSKERRVVSPSKIPLKTSKAANGASSNTGRFIAMPEQNAEKSNKPTDKAVREGKGAKQAGQSVQNGRSSEANVREIEIDVSGSADEVDLRDLLKQTTTQTTGTSSERLVNTTTTTAVQPLQIEHANTLLAEHSDGSTMSQPKERIDVATRPPASKNASPMPAPTQNAASTSQKSAPSAENQSAEANNSDEKDRSAGADVSSIGGHSKSGSVGQNPAKNVKVSGESTAMAETKNGPVGSKVAAKRELPANDKMPTMMENESMVAKAGQEAEAKTATAKTATVKTATANDAISSAAKSNNGGNPAVGAANASVNASGAVVRARNENRGSDASLKSSTGVSTDSIESVRSTDTGVSVNTVRGMSSPREKTGVHMEKRSQEIETLSGNIVRVEQNGEPA